MKMKSAVEKGDLSKAATAQLIIDTATTKTGEYNKKLERNGNQIIYCFYNTVHCNFLIFIL